MYRRVWSNYHTPLDFSQLPENIDSIWASDSDNIKKHWAGRMFHIPGDPKQYQFDSEGKTHHEISPTSPPKSPPKPNDQPTTSPNKQAAPFNPDISGIQHQDSSSPPAGGQ
jgi:hypothetical protein